jgi:acylglycerol lipase
MALFTAVMIPKNQEVKAVLTFCHGYSDHISFMKRKEYQRFVRKGIAVVGIDYEGHGRSDGPSALIYDFQLVVEDVVCYFDQITSTRFPSKKVFLMGEVSVHTMGSKISWP